MQSIGLLTSRSNTWSPRSAPTGRTMIPSGPSWSSRVCGTLGGGGDDDAIERRLLRPAQPAVAEPGGDVVEAQLLEARLGLVEQRLVALDRVDAPAQPRQDRRLVAGPGADLQDLLPRPELERLGHQADHLGWLSVWPWPIGRAVFS